MVDRPRLLDLFCGAGGAGEGYRRAGFDVFGVDLRQRVAYPFDRAVGDALAYAEVHGFRFDAIHASPPCQRYSAGTRTSATRLEHPDLVDVTRDLLVAIGKPWIIENVQGAPLANALTLCGTAFDLDADDPKSGRHVFLQRHRLFESRDLLFGAGVCRCAERKASGWIVGGVYGGGKATLELARTQARGSGGYAPDVEVQSAIMGIDWMPRNQLHQAIPPAYTEWLGRQLIGAVQ